MDPHSTQCQGYNRTKRRGLPTSVSVFSFFKFHSLLNL